MQSPSPLSTNRAIGPIELSILLTSFIAATYAFGIYLFSTLLPDMRTSLSLRYTEVGWMTGSAQIGFLTGALASARLVRWMGEVRLILASVLTCSMCLALMPLMQSAAQIAVPLVIAGCAAATVWVPMVSVVQGRIAGKHQGKVLGLISSGTAYGLFLNGFSVPTLLPLGGWHVVWFFSAALTFVLLAWGVLRLPAGKVGAVQVQAPATHSNGNVGWRTALRQPVAVLVLAMMFLNGLACMPIMNYLLPFLREEVGYSVEAASWVGSAMGFAGMSGGFAMGALADRISVARSLNVTYLLLAMATLLFLSQGPLWLIMLGAALFGLAFNAIFGLLPAFVSQSFDAHKATTVFALGNFMLGSGSMLGNLLGGVLRDYQQSFVPVYIGSLGVDLLLIGLSLYLRRASQRR
jgi:predicted MFS family arabinose efflux permease